MSTTTQQPQVLVQPHSTSTPLSTNMTTQIKSNVTIRHNFSDQIECGINDLINVFYTGAYTCRSMQFYFDRDEVGLYGMADLNRCKADYQLNFVRKLEDYQVVRGGRVCLTSIKKPEKDDWGTPLESLEYLLNMKKNQIQCCLKLHDICETNNDEHLKEFLEQEFLEPLYNSIRKIGVLITNLQRAGTGLGEYEFNKDIELHLKDIVSSHKIKHGVSPSVVTQYTEVPSVNVGHHSSHHSNPISNVTRLIKSLNLSDQRNLLDVLNQVF
jgi:ferritin heavy chain